MDAGCERSELVFLLELAFWTDESWKQLVGMSLPRFRREINRIRQCADLVDRLDRSELVYHATIEVQPPQFAEILKTSALPQQLRGYADALDSLRTLYGPKLKRRRHAWKASIVAVVMEDTKACHDREVSSLVGAVLSDPEYFEKTHQKWRLDHTDYIERARNELLERRSKRYLRPQQ